MYRWSDMEQLDRHLYAQLYWQLNGPLYDQFYWQLSGPLYRQLQNTLREDDV